MQYDFPAIFEHEEGLIAVHFYDDENIVTCGNDLEDAITMAEDVLNLALWCREDGSDDTPIPTPTTDIRNIKLKNNQVVKMIHADTEAYAKKVAAMLEKERIEKEQNPIKAAREQVGMNIKELSDFLGAPYRTIQDWNAGKSKPPKWIQNIIVEKILSAAN